MLAWIVKHLPVIGGLLGLLGGITLFKLAIAIGSLKDAPKHITYTLAVLLAVCLPYLTYEMGVVIRSYSSEQLAPRVIGNRSNLPADKQPGRDEDVAALMRRGAELFRQKEFDQALGVYSKVLSVDGAHGDAYTARGETLQALGRLQDALAAYDAALRVNTRNARAHAFRGTALLELGRNSEALSACEQALSGDPKNKFALQCKGLALFQLKQYAEALAQFDALIALDADHLAGHMGRAVSLEHLGRHSDGQAARRKVDALRSKQQ